MSVPGSAFHAAVDRRNRISARKRKDCIDSVKALVGFSTGGYAPATSRRGRRSRMPSPLCWPWEGRQTASCISSRWPTRRRWLLSWTISSGSEKMFRCWETSSLPGKYVMLDLDRIGGLPMVMKSLLDAGLLNGQCPDRHGEDGGGKPLRTPPGPPRSGHLLPVGAPPCATWTAHHDPPRESRSGRGGSGRLSGKDLDHHTGPARVFEREEDALDAILSGKIRKGDVLVIRYRRPQGRAGNAGDALPFCRAHGRG